MEWSGRSRTVKTPWDQVHVTVGHRQRVIDLAIVGETLEEPESVLTVDSEVVDLL